MSRPRTRRERVRWCGGKVGREHTWSPLQDPPDPLNPCRKIEQPSLAVPPKPLIWWLCNHFLRCTRCGKKIPSAVPCPANTENVAPDPYLKERT